MDEKFIGLLQVQIEKCEEILGRFETGYSNDPSTYIANEGSQWSAETENYLKYAIENQNYLTEFKE